MRKVKRLPTCRRGSVALESALAAVPLIICLAGIFEIVQTVFTSDLLQRAAYRVARATALADTAASDPADLQRRVEQAIQAEIGGMLGFDLTIFDETCTDAESGEESSAAYCLHVSIDVYDDPCDMFCALEEGEVRESQGINAELGGDAGDMVVVRLRLQPQSTLGQTQQQLFGEDGLRALAVMRNERQAVT